MQNDRLGNYRESVVNMKVLIRGGGDLASAVAHKLHNSGFIVVVVELENPLVVRRTVAFAAAVKDGATTVEGVEGRFVDDISEVLGLAARQFVAVTTLPEADLMKAWQPDVFIDATLSKKPVNYRADYAPLTIGLGPKICAGADADYVVETKRGHFLGALIESGEAVENTGIPGVIAGRSHERVHYSEAKGIVTVVVQIGDMVKTGDVIAKVDGAPVCAKLDGVVRGMIADGTVVPPNTKIGDVDPRAETSYCWTISDKGRTISGAVLEAIMRRFNDEGQL